MISDLQVLLAAVAAVGSGLIAGAFFAFSAFVMRALERLPVEHSVAAMQSINIVVINPVFLSIFFGMGLVCAVVFVGALLGWPEYVSRWALWNHVRTVASFTAMACFVAVRRDGFEAGFYNAVPARQGCAITRGTIAEARRWR